MIVDQFPHQLGSEELARHDMVLLGNVATAAHPNSKVGPADELTTVMRPGLDYRIGKPESTEDIGFAGAIIYLENRLDDAKTTLEPISGSSVGADILSFIAQLDTHDRLRRGKTLRTIRNELEQRSLKKYLMFESAIASDAVAVLDQELSHRRRETAAIIGATTIVAGFALSWLRKKR